MKSLLILPCNPGAKTGNYFTGQLWKRFDKKLQEEGLRDQVDFAAIDCIITFLHQDGKGALVHESEMGRVKGFDSHPSKVFSSQKAKDRINKVDILSKDLTIGLRRWHDKYEGIYIFSNVLSYRIGIKNAISKLNIWEKTCLLDFPNMHIGIRSYLIEKIINAISFKTKGIIAIPMSETYRGISKEKTVEWERLWLKRLRSFGV